MEAEAVVLVLDDGVSELEQTIAYVGLSRARSVLVTVGSQRKQQALNWLKRTN
jgi:ATP-dependent exoDNAse (exonuclease V) alpha subunit